MEDETSESTSDSDFSDSFITSDDDDYEDDLNWDSGDSRPPGPSPPSSANMNESPAVAIRARLRSHRVLRRRRPVIAESESPTDEESITVSTDSNPPSPVSTFMIRTHSESVSNSATNNERQSSADDILFDPHSPSHSPSSSVVPSPPLYSPRSPDYTPTSPRSPDYSPPESSQEQDSDVQIIEPPPVQDTTALPGVTESSNNPSPVIQQEPDVAIQVVEPPTVEETVENPQLPQPQELVNPPRDQSQVQVQPPTSDVASLPPSKNVIAQPDPLNITILSESDEGSLCSICMDPLTNSGKHRVVCLRCGHIFGQSCVERWIKVGCNGGARRCPTCNKKACLKDIRVLYLPKVVPLDTVEKDKLIQEKEELAAQKNVIEMELSRCKLQVELNSKRYEEKILKLENDLLEAVTAIELLNQGKKVVPPNIDMKREGVKTELLHMVEMSKDGGCRVLAFNPLLQELVASQPSGNTIFAGYGVRVLNYVDFIPTRFVYLHSKMIRDLAFHGEDRDLLLSASLDHTAKLVDLASSTTVHTFKAEGPLWSCCWDATNPHLLLVGSQLGKVQKYDRRMMDHYINQWEVKNNQTPVVALASAASVARTPFPQGGFLSCRLNGVFAYARHGDEYNMLELPLEGPFMSMRYDSTTQTLLTSSRPSSRCPYARINLNLVDLDLKGNVCLPQIHTFNCGSSARVLSRMTSLPVLNDSLVVAHHESGRTVNMWSSKTGKLVHSFPIREPVIDLTNISLTDDKCLLATLSEKKIGIYKVT